MTNWMCVAGLVVAGWVGLGEASPGKVRPFAQGDRMVTRAQLSMGPVVIRVAKKAKDAKGARKWAKFAIKAIKAGPAGHKCRVDVPALARVIGQRPMSDMTVGIVIEFELQAHVRGGDITCAGAGTGCFVKVERLQ